MQCKLTIAMVAAVLGALPTSYARPSWFADQAAVKPSHGRLDLSGLDPSAFSIVREKPCWMLCATEKLRCPEGMELKQFGECWTCCLK
ncbi:hypothetical protein HGRIS_000059 [Hohenbuehelia grisea]|uniref:Uncharacterized protein n=1 Tax=Hohenbuehelia grisea TaxID=104357 RepID=A0ABR3JPX8_9AGAR